MMQPGRSYSTNKTFQLPPELDAKRQNDKKYIKKKLCKKKIQILKALTE